jgi:endonuclease/exonuclease/phosphatase family metal-dependent hydrolase
MSDSDYARSAEGENANKIDMRDLRPNTTYYFKVRVIKTDGTNLSSYSPAITAKTLAAPTLAAIPNQLSVATYNIHCANCSTDPANSWYLRRDAVVANVKSKMPDVIGVQEASQGWLKDENGNQINLSQFEDFRNRLNAAGAPYEVTNANRNNCVNSATPTNCVYADKGASQDAKIFYNKNTVTLLSQGSVLLPSLPGDSNSRYVAWATFKQNSTGKSFFVTDTHLVPRSGTPEFFEERRQQALKIVQVIAEKNTANLPVLITGDMNSSKWTTPSNAPYDEFTKAGYIDPIGGTWNTSLASGYAPAEKIINGRYSSFNGFNPNLDHTSLTGDRALGSHIDYIFTSKMRVASWEMVLNIDANGVLQGRIPSDHNMIVTKVGLPDTNTSPNPTPATKSAIAVKAASVNGALGAATSGEVYGLKDGGGYQSFERGVIIWSPTTGAHISVGAIRGLWGTTGYEKGTLGYPTSDEILDGRGGVYQTYQRGTIVWSPNIGATISVGAIRSLWLATGGVNGRLGYPTSNEIADGRGGVYQTYQGGVVVWSPTTGAHISVGGIRYAWLGSGGVSGRLGYPTTDEIGGLRDGGVYQMYEGGAIVWSPTTGGFLSFGGIRAIWASTGFENGRLGYPTSNEYSTGANGQVAQNYQGGIIRWSPTGTSITYK